MPASFANKHGQIGKIDTQLSTAEQEAKIDALPANRRTVFHNGRCRLMALIVRNPGRFVVASSGFATLVNTTRIECARDGDVQ